jgi:GT2 family glycosyltransferase
LKSYVNNLFALSFLTSKEIFQQFGGVDESFFMYYEDTDLAWRLKNKKYKTIYDPRSIVRHIHAGSSIEWSPNFRYFVTRNYYINIFKNINIIVLPYFLVKLIFGIIISANEIRLIKALTIRKFRSNNLSYLSDSEIRYIALISSLRNSPGILFIRLKSALSNIFTSKI